MGDPEDILRGWRARGFHGGVWVDPPGQVWRDFVHATVIPPAEK